MKVKSLLALAVLSNVGIAAASDLSYNFVQGSYQQTEIDLGDGINLDLDGYGILGSAELGEQFFITAAYTDASGDDSYFGETVDFSADATSLGFGFHTALSDKLDFVASVAKTSAEATANTSFGEISSDSDAWAYSVGLRGMVGTNVELFASINYLDADEGETDTGFMVGGQYYLTEAFSLGLALDSGDDSDTTSLFARVSF